MTNVSVITGGGGGMGLATAKILGRDTYVVICDVDEQRLAVGLEELKSLGIEGESLRCDITDRGSVGAVVARASAVGRVTSVVHTAGISPHMGSAEKVMTINALGTLNVNEAFLDVAGEGFCIVNVASMAAHMLPGILIPKRAYAYARTDRDRFFRKMMAACNRFPKARRSGIAYSISKNFVTWYSKDAAGVFGEKGARILSVSPGTFDTEMGRLEGEEAAKPVKFAALKRLGRAEEIAELLAFCAGPKPSYLTGTDILCDGGTIAGLKPGDLMRLASSD